MAKDDRLPEDITTYVEEAEDRLKKLIASQFRHCVLVIVSAMIAMFVTSAAVVFLARQPVDEGLLAQLSDSNRQLYGVTEALLQKGLGATSGVTPTVALEAAVGQANLHQQAVEELQRTTGQVTPEAFSVVQLVGGAVVVLLVGVLGLQRLQNIDTEVEGLRRSTSAEMRERVKEMGGMLEGQVDQAVFRRFEATQDDIELLKQEFRTDTSRAKAEFEQSAQDVIGRVEESRKSLETLLARYQWLESAEMREIADEISELVSVEQAHSAGTQFNREEDRPSARAALRRIVDEDLPGKADDFHNAHAEAMKMDDPQLALMIVEKGLQSYPDQYDLMADKAKALISVGRVAEARNLLEDWRCRKPEEFARSWRPVVFYADAIQASELTEESIGSLEAALQDVSKRLPHEPKVWSAYGRFLRVLARMDEAERMMRLGLEYNPYGQELNYVLGEMLLQQGRGEESVEFLERALGIDYQEQYQHDVNQYGLRATLAQAYEAVGRLDDAELHYRGLARESSKVIPYVVKNYAISRLQAIALRRGDVPKGRLELMGLDEDLLALLEQTHTSAGEGLGQTGVVPIAGSSVSPGHPEANLGTPEDLR